MISTVISSLFIGEEKLICWHHDYEWLFCGYHHGKWCLSRVWSFCDYNHGQNWHFGLYSSPWHIFLPSLMAIIDGLAVIYSYNSLFSCSCLAYLAPISLLSSESHRQSRCLLWFVSYCHQGENRHFWLYFPGDRFLTSFISVNAPITYSCANALPTLLPLIIMRLDIFVNLFQLMLQLLVLMLSLLPLMVMLLIIYLWTYDNDH